MRSWLMLLGSTVLAAAAFGQSADFEPLFDGKSLTGWVQKNGTATYAIEGDMIVGRSVADSPNSFLTTVEHFGDFELEFDVKVDRGLNSGVQIRSHSLPEKDNGRVHGYQVEIDPTDGSASGGIYDEARRGWLDDLSGNPERKGALKPDEWNHYRVLAVGPSIKTWVNDKPCADLTDDMTASGFIGLQVHGVGNDPKLVGLMARWKNIRIRRLGPAISDEEAALGWKLLFDGKTSAGWKGARLDRFPEAGWVIKDGMLVIGAGTGEHGKNGGDIVTEKLWRDFEFTFEFNYSEGANSGVKTFVRDDSSPSSAPPLGLEFQILDDLKHPDAAMGFEGNRTLGSLYDLIPASREKISLGAGRWQKGRIVAMDKRVEHWLNGKRTVAYERGSDAFRVLVRHSKFKDVQGFGEADEGRILLQDHGSEVRFRNLKIRELWAPSK